MIAVETTMAPFMAISWIASGVPRRIARLMIFGSNAQRSLRRCSAGLATQQRQSIKSAMAAQASAVPMPAPSTPKRGMNRALNTTSSAHMTLFRMLGVRISPLHCKKEAASELSCKNGTMSANTRK